MNLLFCLVWLIVCPRSCLRNLSGCEKKPEKISSHVHFYPQITLDIRESCHFGALKKAYIGETDNEMRRFLQNMNT